MDFLMSSMFVQESSLAPDYIKGKMKRTLILASKKPIHIDHISVSLT